MNKPPLHFLLPLLHFLAFLDCISVNLRMHKYCAHLLRNNYPGMNSNTNCHLRSYIYSYHLVSVGGCFQDPSGLQMLESLLENAVVVHGTYVLFAIFTSLTIIHNTEHNANAV